MLLARTADGGVAACWLLLFTVLFELLLILFALTSLAALAAIDKLEFLRDAAADAFFLDLVLVPPTGTFAPDPRFRFLITSVFNERGRTTPCNLRNSPQALHSG
jgi:hypothetical protein